MRLYKNVDVCDLKSILENGILSIDECGNNNWEEGKRANNRTDKVYLFEPISNVNSFTNYGVILLECEVDNAIVNGFDKYDVNKNKYKEYIVDGVDSENIIKIIAPVILKDKIKEELSSELLDKITWCDMKAKDWKGNYVNENTLLQFAKTMEISINYFGYFRGVKEDREVFDLYDIEYIY